MTDVGFDGTPTDADRAALVAFLSRLRDDLAIVLATEESTQEDNPFPELFELEEAKALARRAFEDGVVQNLGRMIRVLERDDPRLGRNLRRFGLTGANLEFKLWTADRHRETAQTFLPRSAREALAAVARYFGVSSSIVGSIAAAFDSMPPWAKFLAEMVKEFLDMLETLASAHGDRR
ncbi:hypothetical protein GCM10009422_07670 [Brevundimonas kwangchunensis]|uniref:Uncharacterized protein n=1 Tax=Brevundimonas kwangchunensis TaxID=322163 RepID=A0ABN1GP51_9CAUL